ncbi:MAG TPA: SDR family oxidoreductase [Planktothrix sp.]|jgi:NAD(P)-dependent dehydrogenase (short-subunit alcohol dehydrogenase family)
MDGLTALITGGGSGIGLATARTMLERGANVMIVGRDQKKLVAAAESLGHEGKLKFMAGDVSSEGYANKLVKDTVKAFGKLDILINNAGVFRNLNILEMDEDEFDYDISNNLKGTWFMCKFGAKAMLASGGSIVNISSLLAKQALPGVPSSAYSAAKAGIIGLTHALAIELAPHKIRVNVVLPAVIRTPILAAGMGDEMTAKIIERGKKLYPMGRVGEAEDVARAIVFLADPVNAWITGTELTVDGGISNC